MRKRVTDKNYDLIFKLVANVFKGRLLEFLSIDCPRISRVFPTELPKLEANTMHTDFMFELQDQSLLHLEFQSDFNQETLYRMFMYDARMVVQHHRKIKTILIYSGASHDIDSGFDMGVLQYNSDVILMKNYNGDEIFAEEMEKIQRGMQPNWLNLIFFPIMNSKVEVKERVQKVIKLCEKTRLKKSHYEAVVASVLVLADKFLKQMDYDNIWEEISMLNVIKFAERKGIEKGMEKGIEEGIGKVILLQLKNKLSDLPVEYITKIKTLNEAKLEQIAKDIFVINEAQDLDKYLS